jgi:transcription termination/antitermination protein NusG
MSPDDDQPAVDSALNGDEPTPAQETSLKAEPNGSDETQTPAEEADASTEQSPRSEQPSVEPEASTPEPQPEPEAEAIAATEPEPAIAEEEAAAAVSEEASSPIAAEFERALQAAAEKPEPDEPKSDEPKADEEAPAVAEAEPEPTAVVEASVPIVEPSTNGDAAAAEAEAAEGEGDAEEDEALARAFQPGDWFVVHTYAGYENKVKTNLESRISSMNVEEKIFEVVIPMEDVMEIKSGKKQVVQRKVFPGYLLVRMDLDDDSWYVVRNTPGVTGFVGSGARPIPLSEREVDRILQRKPVGERPKPKLEWSVNDPVRVTTGPFANFQGLISEIDTDRSKLKVLVNIFGRETPVELGFDQVAKV